MRLFRNATALLAATVLAATFGSCTSSPTEPKSPPVTPKPPVPVTTFSVSVTANPPNITAGSGGSSTITVEVRQNDNGQPPPDGSQVTINTTLGTFNSASGPTTVTLALVNGRAQASLFSGTDVGTAAVTATYNGATGAANVHINSAATFFVSSVSPNLGDAAGGQTVTVLGGGFSQPVRVTFGGAAATVRSVSPSQIVVVTPSAAAAGAPVQVGQTASVSVLVTNHVNQPDQQVDGIDRGFTYSVGGGGGGGQPAVFAVNPASGTNDGGTRVTITGTGFQSPVQVLFGIGGSASDFNGVEATVVSVTPTQIVAITPAARGFGQNLTNQVVDILVKNVNSGFSAVGSQQFKYGSKVLITAMGPGSGPSSGGTRVTIDGSGFEGPVAVSFTFTNPNVSVAQQVVSVSGTQIVILTSPAPLPTTCPTNGLVSANSVSVTNINTGDGASASLGFNFQIPLPVINSLNPTSGGTGAHITIQGSGFNPESTGVTFGNGGGGSSATVTGGTSSSINVIVPNPPSGFTFNTVPCGNGGKQNVATPISINVTDRSTGCTSSFTNGFLLNPSDTSCQGQQQTTPPTASFTATPLGGHKMQFADTSTGSPTSWTWDFGDGSSISTEIHAQNPSHTYAAAGPYSVKLTACNAGGCSSQAVQVIIVP